MLGSTCILVIIIGAYARPRNPMELITVRLGLSLFDLGSACSHFISLIARPSVQLAQWPRLRQGGANVIIKNCSQ